MGSGRNRSVPLFLVLAAIAALYLWASAGLRFGLVASLLEQLGEPSLTGAILVTALDIAVIAVPWLAIAAIYRRAAHNTLAALAPFAGAAALYLGALLLSSLVAGRIAGPVSYELFSPAVDAAVDLGASALAGALMWLLPARNVARESALTV